MYILGYGSLVTINSAQTSYKRESKPVYFIVVEINGTGSVDDVFNRIKDSISAI